MATVGDRIGSGRSADIYEYGDGRVLRRRRNGPVSEAAVVVMRAVRAGGFPVPQVFSVNGCDMTMERIGGVDLLTHLSKRPWTHARSVSWLAALHNELAAIPTGNTLLLTEAESRESFVHGDLHPGNVMLTPGGPVVIDWEGAGIGARDADVATTWLLLETAEADDVPRLVRPLVGMIRRTVLRSFLGRVKVPRPETVAAVCADRLKDPNMRPEELKRIRGFAEARMT